MSTSRIIAGAMSGTSADGVDVALTRIGGRGLEMTADLVHHGHRPYPHSLRDEIFAFRGGAVHDDFLRRLARLGREISLTYATAVNEALAAAKLSADDLAAVAAHGQTLFHDPPDTIQWLDPSLIAAEVGCAVVSDFRRADLAAGGQGAPLVPFADYLLFRHSTKNRVLLNIGGIANITYLPAGDSMTKIIGFDTGPGNCVLDYLAREHHLPGGFDRDGRLSIRGKPDVHLASLALSKWKFVHSPPPKTADIPEMIQAFTQAMDQVNLRSLPLADQMATACQMTSLGIAMALTRLPDIVDEIIGAGGGMDNPGLVKAIEAGVKMPLLKADDFGIPSQAKEALAFALLGAATLDGLPSNIPSVTGARRAVVLGSVTPKP